MAFRLTLALLLFAVVAFAKCIPYSEAPERIGATTCVAGKVLKVAQTKTGTHFLNFCQDYKTCPFTVVVFASRLRDVGDVRLLEGKDIQVSGKIKQWHGRAEIVLNDARQLKGQAGKLPPVPKDYDVEKRGRFRAGDGRTYSTERTRGKKPRAPADDDFDVSQE